MGSHDQDSAALAEFERNEDDVSSFLWLCDIVKREYAFMILSVYCYCCSGFIFVCRLSCEPCDMA